MQEHLGFPTLKFDVRRRDGKSSSTELELEFWEPLEAMIAVTVQRKIRDLICATADWVPNQAID